MTSALFDLGLQPERTLLAWRRTCLAFGVASAFAARFIVIAIGWPALVLGLLGVTLAGLAYGLMWRRYRLASVALTRTDRLEHGAIPVLLASASGMVVGMACLVYVVAHGVEVDSWPR